MKVLKYIGLSLIAVLVLSFAGLKAAQRMSDGPLGPVQGGPFRTGEFIQEPAGGWSIEGAKRIELQLVNPPTSRIVGLMERDGKLYIPCDLGFIWTRFQDQWMTRTMYYLKTWHQHAVEDGRVVLRIDGKRFLGQAERVTDPKLVARLKSDLEDVARQYIAPAELPQAPTSEPNDVWFFRVDARPSRME